MKSKEARKYIFSSLDDIVHALATSARAVVHHGIPLQAGAAQFGCGDAFQQTLIICPPAIHDRQRQAIVIADSPSPAVSVISISSDTDEDETTQRRSLGDMSDEEQESGRDTVDGSPTSDSSGHGSPFAESSFVEDTHPDTELASSVDPEAKPAVCSVVVPPVGLGHGLDAHEPMANAGDPSSPFSDCLCPSRTAVHAHLAGSSHLGGQPTLLPFPSSAALGTAAPVAHLLASPCTSRPVLQHPTYSLSHPSGIVRQVPVGINPRLLPSPTIHQTQFKPVFPPHSYIAASPAYAGFPLSPSKPGQYPYM
ncbi:Homeodomain-interacting protein kinase 3 [Tupaia chinensis]|uniref:Homeodomain-interacting protein kinase 3 n=1 Tax=Tupaia chinensis TaxID=246437 RepID=L8YBH8_TUPCH|nr:Homeodomain-interacting protein kinase 3 [Tupaia chinensis]